MYLNEGYIDDVFGVLVSPESDDVYGENDRAFSIEFGGFDGGIGSGSGEEAVQQECE